MRKQTKIAAIVSAAALLAIGASMTSFAMWRQTVEGSDEWAYYDRYWEIDMSEGWHRGEEGWTHGPESWYFADENGIMKRNELFEFEDNLYYVYPDGHRAENEWVAVDADDDVEMADERVSFDVVYYYFNSTGKAIKAKDGSYEAIKLKKDNGVDAEGTFVFNGDGVMQIGRVPIGDDIYYCVQKYDSLSIKLAAGKKWNYVTGQALTGWAKMDTEAIVEDTQLAREDYEDQEWFYFDKGKLVTNNTAKKINGKYYSFDEAGVMISDNTNVGLATASDATPGSSFPENPDVYVYADGDGLASTGNRFVNFQDLDWYYIVNIRDEDTRELVSLQKGGAGQGRAVIFNKQKTSDKDGGKAVTAANRDQYPSRMISVGGKRFMIGADGVMITGAYKITQADYDAWVLAEGGDGDKNENIKVDGKAKWNGIDYVIPTYEDESDNKKLHIVEPGNYLFFDDSEDLDGDRGELTVGRVTYDDDDDGQITRFFTANGKVDEWAIYGDYLYHNGLLYTSEDGDRYALVSLDGRVVGKDNDGQGNVLADGTVLNGKKGYMWRYKLRANVPNKDKMLKLDTTQTEPAYLIVDYNGRVQKGYTSSGKTVTIDDGTKYEVIYYVATEQK